MYNNCSSCLLCRLKLEQADRRTSALRRVYVYVTTTTTTTTDSAIYHCQLLSTTTAIVYYYYYHHYRYHYYYQSCYASSWTNRTKRESAISRRDLARRGTWSSLFFIIPSILPFICVTRPWLLKSSFVYLMMYINTPRLLHSVERRCATDISSESPGRSFRFSKTRTNKKRMLICHDKAWNLLAYIRKLEWIFGDSEIPYISSHLRIRSAMSRISHRGGLIAFERGDT